MPQISNTPESVLPRSDSRNPTTTCRGITAQGRPCRRALASSQTSSPASTPRKSGVQYEVSELTSFYCWQHKDQAVLSSMYNDTRVPEKPRTSIDTLMDRLGVLEIKDEKTAHRKTHRRRQTSQVAPEKPRPRPKRIFCCFEIVDEEGDSTPSKPVQKPLERQSTHGSSPTSQRPLQKSQRPIYAGGPQHIRVPSSRQQAPSGPQTPSRPSRPTTKKSSQTQSLLSWIPSTLSPQTTSLLLTELAKPISDADEEGYIYMFWVTPPRAATCGNTQSPMPRDITSSILPPAPTSTNEVRSATRSRSVSDAISAARDLNALTSNPTSTTPGTIRLKIGRTSNVHRRLNEWTRQCSHDLTLIRYYPYTPSASASSSPSRVSNLNAHLLPGRKVPHVHRVERLIHLELADLRVRDLGRCSECGKEHREWFEVAAAKEALRRVDECVRRWVNWGESNLRHQETRRSTWIDS